jgi:hypothetical protein
VCTNMSHKALEQDFANYLWNNVDTWAKSFKIFMMLRFLFLSFLKYSWILSKVLPSSDFSHQTYKEHFMSTFHSISVAVRQR